ncbi:MAG: hypothetical protein EPO62_06680 [Candidatus Nitrosotenuis sp.]|nr:MAG: hypothetical protein EPO62_06680 [Candidatus Nitrosotenuis sp.]
MIKTLTKVADRYSPSRVLSFNIAHVFKTMQLASEQIRVSRMTLVADLGLGEGSVKTLVKHLKMHGLVETSKGGMRLSEKGKILYSKISATVPRESPIQKCSIGLGTFNHAVLLKGFGSEINSGLEQRDFAKFMGATGATTLVYKNKRFLMPGQTQDSLKNERKIRESIMENLLPQNDDAIIIASADDKKTADLASKYAALMTVADHHKHF